MHGHSHTCRYCSRSFKRAEHLTRHLRTHTREKPFVCQCSASFTRRDLLTRHWRITGHSATGVSSDEQVPETQTPAQHNIAPSDLSVVNEPLENETLEAPNHHHRPELPTPVESFHDAQGHIDPPLHHGPYMDEGFEDFRDFVNFIDGVGLSAQWTPEYNIDWMRLDNYRASRRPSGEQEPQPSPDHEDIGTPFSTWLPSAPDFSFSVSATMASRKKAHLSVSRLELGRRCGINGFNRNHLGVRKW